MKKLGSPFIYFVKSECFLTSSELVTEDAKKQKTTFGGHIVTQMDAKPLDTFSLGSYPELQFFTDDLKWQSLL